MQNATPLLAAVLLWLSTQNVAADLGADTLRNTFVRSVRRGDVLFGKLAVLLGATLGAWLALVAVTLAFSAMLCGFGDLEEVTRYGDRDLLIAADNVRPVLYVAALQLLLPLAAVVLLGMAASTLARRPALALLMGAMLVLLPELLRATLGELL